MGIEIIGIDQVDEITDNVLDAVSRAVDDVIDATSFDVEEFLLALGRVGLYLARVDADAVDRARDRDEGED